MPTEIKVNPDAILTAVIAASIASGGYQNALNAINKQFFSHVLLAAAEISKGLLARQIELAEAEKARLRKEAENAKKIVHRTV